jgi:hypothetical protein
MYRRVHRRDIVFVTDPHIAGRRRLVIDPQGGHQLVGRQVMRPQQLRIGLDDNRADIPPEGRSRQQPRNRRKGGPHILTLARSASSLLFRLSLLSTSSPTGRVEASNRMIKGGLDPCGKRPAPGCSPRSLPLRPAPYSYRDRNSA